MAKRVKTEKAEIKSVTNKKFADRYVNENYFRLAGNSGLWMIN